jgi:LPXTG-site transpeptidase (sortase) family protein
VERRSILDLTPLRLGVAVVAIVVSLAVLAFVLRPSDGTEDSTAQSPAPPDTTAVVSDAPAAATATPSASTPSGDGGSPAQTLTAESTPTAAATSTPASVGATATPRPQPGADVKLQIPAIGVDAWVIRMGLDDNGVMEVPYNGELVAWYDFTSVPGAPGNAVMSAHLDYRGSTAVFWRLGDLEDGDRVTVLLEGEPIDYVVSRVYLTRPEDANLREILGGRSGPETLTLITCGGVWDSAEGEYDHRVIVQATRVV